MPHDGYRGSDRRGRAVQVALVPNQMDETRIAPRVGAICAQEHPHMAPVARRATAGIAPMRLKTISSIAIWSTRASRAARLP